MNPESSNPFAVAATQAAGAIQVAQSQSAQEIQAQLVVAKKYPRDQNIAYQQILEACKRKGLAEEASYLYSRGGTTITGASIRLLEVVAQHWGNFRSGIVELDNQNGESRLEAFAWDLQTNTYDSKTFTVRHERYSKEGGITKLTDPRDQYEHVANFSARRKRACMEAVIPRDVIDDALDECDKTLKAGHSEPIADRTRKMVAAFAEHGITIEMIERRIQHKLSAVIEQELVVLRKIYTSLKDGVAKREDFFDLTAAPKPAKFEQADAAAKKAADEKAEAAAGLAPAATTPVTAHPPVVPQPVAQQPAAAAPAPATPPAPAMTPAERMAKARAKKAENEAAAKAAAPAQAPQAAQPTQGTDLFTPPAAAAPATTEPTAESEIGTLVSDVLVANNMTEPEVLNVLKVRQIADPKCERLLQLPAEILEDLVENCAIIAAQVRIDRRAKSQ